MMDSIVPPKRFAITIEFDVVEKAFVSTSRVTTGETQTRRVSVDWLDQNGAIRSYTIGNIIIEALGAHMSESAPQLASQN